MTKTIQLTKRQQCILSCIDKCDVLADVGCDHGYIGLSALVNSVTDMLYLTDISANSLSKATDLADKLHIDKSKYMDICQNGLQSILCNTAVIGGMGGLEIISIIDGASVKPTRLVLQPMRNHIDLRRYLLSVGYCITKDYIICDNKYYFIICADNSRPVQLLTSLQLELGHTNLSRPNQDYVDYLDTEINKCKTILVHTDSQSQQDRLQLLLEARGKI